MPNFAIAPPLQVRGQPAVVIRSIEQAVDFMRRVHLTENTAAILSRLTKVRTASEAQRACETLRACSSRSSC
jgi:hypothetical protein